MVDALREYARWRDLRDNELSETFLERINALPQLPGDSEPGPAEPARPGSASALAHTGRSPPVVLNSPLLLQQSRTRSGHTRFSQPPPHLLTVASLTHLARQLQRRLQESQEDLAQLEKRCHNLEAGEGPVSPSSFGWLPWIDA